MIYITKYAKENKGINFDDITKIEKVTFEYPDENTWDKPFYAIDFSSKAHGLIRIYYWDEIDIDKEFDNMREFSEKAGENG